MNEEEEEELNVRWHLVGLFIELSFYRNYLFCFRDSYI